MDRRGLKARRPQTVSLEGMQVGKGIEIEKIREVRRQEDWKEEVLRIRQAKNSAFGRQVGKR